MVLQYDANDARRSRPEIDQIDNGFGRFKVLNHIEIPKSDMQYDVAVRTILQLDKRYEPFAIYPDRGAGDISPLPGVIPAVNRPKSGKPKAKAKVIPR